MQTLTNKLFSLVAFWFPLALSSSSFVGSEMTFDRQLDDGSTEICFQGFVMDIFCINRGTLLDNPGIKTLEGPDRHSVHCLVDVSRCVNSGYELLLDPAEEGGMYGRAFRLDETGNQKVLDLARRLGDACSTCTGDGTQVEGFRATVLGVIDPDSGTPPLLKVTQLRRDNSPCTEAEGGQFAPLNVTFESGSEGNGANPVSVHGSIMATAWGFFLPLGVLSSRFLRHRPDGLWFILHRVCNTVGMILTVIGVIIAFVRFDNVFTDREGPSFRHGVMGVTTMSLGILQAIGGILRPHIPEQEREKERKRIVWEILHKCTGYALVGLAYATIYFGAEVAGAKKQTFKGVFYATLIFAGVVIVAMLYDKFTYKDLANIGMDQKVVEVDEEAEEINKDSRVEKEMNAS